MRGSIDGYKFDKEDIAQITEFVIEARRKRRENWLGNLVTLTITAVVSLSLAGWAPYAGMAVAVLGVGLAICGTIKDVGHANYERLHMLCDLMVEHHDRQMFALNEIQTALIQEWERRRRLE